MIILVPTRHRGAGDHDVSFVWDEARDVDRYGVCLIILVVLERGPRIHIDTSACLDVGGKCISIGKSQFFKLLHPRFNEVESGVYWLHLVRLSVSPSVDRIVSALYLQQYSSDPFHICTSYQATSEGVSRVMFVSNLKTFKFWQIL